MNLFSVIYRGISAVLPDINAIIILLRIIFHDHQERTHSFDGHRTDVTTDLAIKEIRELSQNKKPFILFVLTSALSLQPSAEFLKPYLERPIHLRANCHPEIEPYTSTGSPRSPRPKETDPTYDLYGDLIAYLRHYYALCSQVDAGIGRIAGNWAPWTQ